MSLNEVEVAEQDKVCASGSCPELATPLYIPSSRGKPQATRSTHMRLCTQIMGRATEALNYWYQYQCTTQHHRLDQTAGVEHLGCLKGREPLISSGPSSFQSRSMPMAPPSEGFSASDHRWRGLQYVQSPCKKKKKGGSSIRRT
jgi:hypothetical protein